MCEPLLTHRNETTMASKLGSVGGPGTKARCGGPSVGELPVCGPGGARCIGGVSSSQALAWNRRTCRPDRDGRRFWPREGEPQAARHCEWESTDAGHRGGPARSSGEGPVMGPERRGRAVHGRLEVNPSGEEPTDRPRQKNAGLWEPYDGRLSRTVLREREGEVPSRHSPGSVGAWTGWPATLRGARCAPCVLTQRPHPRRDMVDALEDFVEGAGQVECDYVKLFARVFDTV